MNSKHLLAASCMLAMTFGSASGAMAQANAAAPAIKHGPPIAGICVFSVQAAIAQSTVGKYLNTRMQQIVSQVNAELNGENTAVENEAKALDAQSKAKTIDQATLAQRGNALNTKYQALQQKAALREREIQATQQKALDRVATEMEPLALQAYQSKNCSLLINGQAVSAVNPAMDLTPQVVTALNAKITQFPFDRERLDQAAPGGQAAPAR